MSKKRTILIVDDSDIDRTILKTILDEEFEIIEKNSGFAAINFLRSNKDELDALLLDISMPAVDGFDVLQFMKDSNILDISVFLITSEATVTNVQKATQYGVTEFIRKPFNKEYITKRIKQQVGVISEYTLTDTDIQEMNKYIKKLHTIYDQYLKNLGIDSGHYKRISDLMHIMLTNYAVYNAEPALDKERIDIISKAGYFYDIGAMAVPSGTAKTANGSAAPQDRSPAHAIMGTKIISLNFSKHCRYFVDVCSDICIHHHERYDGKGYPHKILKDHNLIYSQMCRLACDFDCLFSEYQTHSKTLFTFVSSELAKDEGNVSKKVLASLTDCADEIVSYYQAQD